MRTLLAAIAATLTFILFLPSANAEATWLTDYKAGLAQAKSQKKMVLLDFTGSDWCPDCALLERQVFSQKEFSDYAASNLVLVRLDFPHKKELPRALAAQNEMLSDAYRVEAFPTLIVLNPKGHPVAELLNPGNPKDFVAELKKLKGK